MGTLLNRRRYMGESGGGEEPLPQGGVRIEYIETNGTQWIDSGIIPTPTTYVRCKFVNLVVTGEVIIGFHDTEGDAWRLFNVRSNYIYFDLPNTSSSQSLRMTSSSNGIAVGALCEFELGNRYVKNLATGMNILSNNTLSVTNGTNTIGISGTMKKGTTLVTSQNRFYYIQIFNDDEIVFDGIPARIGSIGYLYDFVTGQYFGNDGTGSFTLGPDKT